MKTPLIRFTALIVAFAFASELAFGGSWKMPPAIRVHQVADGAFFLRNLSESKTIEIWDSDSMKRLWDSPIPGYSALFSRFFLTDDGQFLVYLRTNHMINSIDDICLEVFGRDGFRDTYHVNEVHEKLPRYQPRNSASPRYAWHYRTMWLSRTGGGATHTMIVHLGESGYAWFAIGKHAVEVK
jgi:hypothetical protein